MANEKLVTLEHLGTVKNYIDAKDAKAIKSAEFADNTVKLYSTEDKSGTPVVSFDLPEEMFLDQSKTAFEEAFTWSDTKFPGSTNPNLEGKPVLILAVKGDTDITYSFISLEKLIKTYTAEDTSTVDVTVADSKISAAVKVSATTGNTITVNADGLYVPTPESVTYATNAEVEALFATT